MYTEYTSEEIQEALKSLQSSIKASKSLFLESGEVAYHENAKKKMIRVQELETVLKERNTPCSNQQ